MALATKPPIDKALHPGTWIEMVAPVLVGNVPMDVAQNVLKQAMLTEAMQRTSGNLAGAARLLGVTRQAIQQMLNRFDMRPPRQHASLHLAHPRLKPNG